MPSIFCCLLLVYVFLLPSSVLMPICLVCGTSSVSNSLQCPNQGIVGAMEILSPTRMGEEREDKEVWLRERGAISVVRVNNPAAILHTHHPISWPCSKPCQPCMCCPDSLAPHKLLCSLRALLHLYVCLDCTCQVSPSAHLTEEFLWACCKTWRQWAQLEVEKGCG